MRERPLSKPKAYSYVRFSTPEQAQGDSFRRQVSAAEKFASENSLELDTSLTLHDLGVSAFSGANVRKGALGQFLRAIDDGEVEDGSYLLVENLDRVSRANPWEAFPLFQQIINAGITIVTLQDGRTYTREGFQQNPIGILESLFTMIRANEESETKSRRLKAAWKQKRHLAAAERKPMTSRVPAWLSISDSGERFKVLEDRAAVVRRIFKEADAGKGQHQIAEGLNKEGVETFGDGTRKAKFWHRSYVAKILSNPATTGTFVPHITGRANGLRQREPQQPITDYYPRIVSKGVFDRVQKRRLGANTPRIRAEKGQVSSVLAGLARCPACGNTMTRVNKGRKGGTPYLVCTAAKAGAGCSYRTVQLTVIEAAVRFAGTRSLVHAAPVGDANLDEKQTQLQASMDGIDAAIINLLEELEAGNSTPALRRRLAELEATAEEMRGEWEHLHDRVERSSKRAVRRIIGRLEKTFENSKVTVTEMNTALRDAFDRCVVDYRSGELLFHWKHSEKPTVVPFGFLIDEEVV